MEDRGFWTAIAVRSVIGLAIAGVFFAVSYAAIRSFRYRAGSDEPPAVQAAVSVVAAALIPSPLMSAPAENGRPPRPVAPPPTASVPDLAVGIVDTGILINGQFNHADTVERGERPAVVFEVTNIGSAVSDRWQFTANIPASPSALTSAIQRPLAPREGLRYTLGFFELGRAGENEITISVFSWREGGERNIANNAATAVIVRGY